jgi:malate/lactate dehydrogenase
LIFQPYHETMPAMKVTILGGAGGIGASTAFNLALQGAGNEIVLVDTRPRMVTSHVMDLDQVLEQRPGCVVRGGELSDAADADVVVLAASTPLLPDVARLEYLAGNAAIADELTADLDASWPGVILVATNPVDPLVTRLHDRTGIDRRRVVGYTVNDTLRYRTGLARALGASPGSVEAWVLGEHGELSVPLRDHVRVDGADVHPTAAQLAAGERYFRTWYPQHVALDSGRSSTWTSGLGLSRMVAALGGAGELWPASVVLDGEYGIGGAAVTVPVTLGDGGVREIHVWDLHADDLEALRASADLVRAAVADAGGAPPRTVSVDETGR